MRRFLVQQAPTVSALFVMVVVFLSFAAVLGPGLEGPGTRMPAVPAEAIALPPADMDRDGDTYADDVDLRDGDIVVDLVVSRISLPASAGALPYLLVGTQDDHWRTGANAALEWRHVVDHDPLGHQPGSPGWIDSALRTGAWWRSIPLEGESHAMARGPAVEEASPGGTWPQSFVVNVRDDRPRVVVGMEAWDSARRPHARVGTWSFEVDVLEGRWRLGDGAWHASGEAASFGSFEQGGQALEVTLALGAQLDADVQESLARRWAPVLMFHQDERFFPTRGDALEAFHGFSVRESDHRTWALSFNNARHGYRLLLADFTGDGTVGHEDAALLYEVLRAGQAGEDRVYAQVQRTTGDRVVVQYWFLYMFNFLLDETGRDVARLAHAGDREFMQLVFEDLDAAQNGTPLHVTYSQHYSGVRVPYEAGSPPFHLDAGHPAVFVAQGSHASYPAAGTDAQLRHSLQGFGDVFFGDGEAWAPEDYEVELLGSQTWHAGYLWGPVTRHSRDMGTAARPLLQHGFSYPFLDPLHWETTVPLVEAARLQDLYGGAP